MLLPVKFIFSIQIHRAIFSKIPMGEIENSFYCFGRLIFSEPAGRGEEQEQHHKNEQYSR